VSSNATIAALAAACALGVAGCEATITPPRPVITIESEPLVAPVAVVPPDIWAYPRVWYAGTYVYLVNGSWYQPTRSGWMVFRREPVQLSRERTRIYASRPAPPPPGYAYPPPARRPPLQEPTEFGRERTPNP
jgi:hypothetical protein